MGSNINRTALFSRHQPGGLFTVADMVDHPGNIWFVDSALGSDAAGYGRSPDTPFATVDYACAACTASQGDVVYVMPGHHESITAATSCNFSTAGVSVIGLGRGRNRPILDFDNTAGSVEMDSANCRLSNVILRASVSATVVGINVDADDCEIDHCEFTWEATGDEFICTIDLDAVDRCHIHDNVFDTETGSAQATRCIRLDDTEDSCIERNVFRGTWSDACIINEGVLCARLLILDNIIYNSDTTNYNGVDMGALSTTGIFAGNTVTALYATAVAKIYRDGDLMSGDNRFCNAVSLRAASLLPATSAS